MARPAARRLHTWLGLCAGAFVLVSAGTGTLLSYRDALGAADPIVPEALQGEAPRPVMELVAEAERRVGAAAAELYFPRTPEQPVCIVLADEDMTELYFSPGGTLVAEKKGTDKGLTQWLFDLHTGAVLGEAGEVVVSVVGVALCGSLLTGVLIWPWLLIRRRGRAKG